MRHLAFLLLLLTMPMAASAQEWRAELRSDAAYAGGWVVLPSYAMGFSCAARSPAQGSVIDSAWFEVSIARPWHYLISISENQIPYSEGTRGDLILFVDQTGYQLPPVMHNEMEGGWQFELPMTDALFTHLPNATRLVLQVGSQTAWELPVANLGPSLDSLRTLCAGTWTATGHGTPAGVGSENVGQTRYGQPPADLRTAAEIFAASNCSDFFNAGPGAFRTGDIDGDGVADVVLDYNEITCGNAAQRPGVCGASLCSVDVFLSRTFSGTGQPENLMGMSSDLVALTNGNQAVVTSGNLSICQSLEPCAFYWYWNGAEFTELQQ